MLLSASYQMNAPVLGRLDTLAIAVSLKVNSEINICKHYEQLLPSG